MNPEPNATNDPHVTMDNHSEPTEDWSKLDSIFAIRERIRRLESENAALRAEVGRLREALEDIERNTRETKNGGFEVDFPNLLCVIHATALAALTAPAAPKDANLEGGNETVLEESNEEETHY